LLRDKVENSDVIVTITDISKDGENQYLSYTLMSKSGLTI